MECIRRIVNSNDLTPSLMLPRSFSNRKVEILITLIDDEKSETSGFIDSCIEDAIARYKIANGRDCAFHIPEELISELKLINFDEKPLFSIRNDSFKVVMFKDGKKYNIDYKESCPDIVMISNFSTDSSGKRLMNISEIAVNSLSKFFENA